MNAQRSIARHADGLMLGTGALILFFGLIVVFGMPPTQGQDEPNHFLRVNALISGILVPEPKGVNAPTSFDACLADYLGSAGARAGREGPMRLGNFDDYPSGCEDRPPVEIDYDNTAVYSPVAYAPMLPAVAVNRVLGTGPVASFYSARIFNLLGYLALVLAALRFAPYGRIYIAVVALLPMALLQAGTVHTDGIAYGLALLAAALTLRLRDREEPDRRGLIALVAVLVGLGLTKVPHIAFIALLLVVPWRHFAPDPRRANLLRAGAFFLPVAIMGGWNLLISDLQVNNLPTVDPGRQARYILENPFAFLENLRVSLFTDASRNFWIEMPGAFSFFRPLPVDVKPSLPLWAVVTSYILLAFALAAGRRPELVADRKSRMEGAWVLVAGLGGVALVYLSLYLIWTDVGADYVNGIKAHYFPPFLSFLVVAAAILLKRGSTVPRWPPFLAVSALLLVVISYQVSLVYY